MFKAYLFLTLALFIAAPRAIPASNPIYNEKADAASDVRAAVREAGRSHRNVVLIFGANWCGDCRALDQQMHQPGLAPLIAKYYVVVKVDIGKGDKNLDLGAKYHVVPGKGIPTITILDPHGTLLYAQPPGSPFTSARRLDYQTFKTFFERWEPKG